MGADGGYVPGGGGEECEWSGRVGKRSGYIFAICAVGCLCVATKGTGEGNICRYICEIFSIKLFLYWRDI